jgi:hypothetical protein
MESTWGNWLAGIAASAIGLVGLVAAAKSADPLMYVVGLTVFGAAVLFDFWMIRASVGRNH